MCLLCGALPGCLMPRFFDEDFCDYVRISGNVGPVVIGARVVDDPVLKLARGATVELAKPQKGEGKAAGVLGLERAADGAARKTGKRGLNFALPPVVSARPASTLRQRMAKSELQMRAAQPLKMDPWGSNLALVDQSGTGHLLAGALHPA